MENYSIKAEIREKTQRDEEQSKIPAILYGKGLESKMLWVSKKSFNKIYKEAGESTVIDFVVEGDKEQKPQKVLIYDLQQDPISDEFTHIDFYVVRMDEEIETGVELKFVGEAPAVKNLGGVLVKSIDEVEVRCLPGDLPKEIEVDISVLETFDDNIHIKELKISDKVKIDLDPETVVATVAPPRTQEELEDLEKEVEGDVSQVEGIKKDEEAESQTGEPEKKEEKKEE